jgi:hypothetical protein
MGMRVLSLPVGPTSPPLVFGIVVTGAWTAAETLVAAGHPATDGRRP